MIKWARAALMPRQARLPGQAASRRPPLRPARGFTLVELLVAITLMAVVSLMAWRGLDSITRLRDHLQQRSDQTDALLRLLGQLERDLVLRAPDMVLAAAMLPPLPPGAPQPPRTLPLAIDVSAAERGGRGIHLDVVRAGPAQAGSWQRVAWWLEGDQLWRAAGAPSPTYPLPAADPRQAALVLDRVRDFAVFGWIDGSGWQPLPRPPGANTPVTGLQIVITRDGGDQDETYRRVMAFP